MRAHKTAPGKVAVVVGGGSGHYPAFCGVVGPGFADGAVVGNIFTSPSADEAASVARAAHGDAGVLLTTGNYAGDVMNFNLAVTQLRSEGIDAHYFAVTDDIASAPKGEEAKRRGIAGDFTVFKCASAAAEDGLDLPGVIRVAEAANAATRTFGVAFDGCTLPGADEPLFTVPEGKMGIGLGIHGEPGVADEDMPTAADLAADACRRVGRREARIGISANCGDPQRTWPHQVRGTVRGVGHGGAAAAGSRVRDRGARSRRTRHQPRHGRVLADDDVARRRTRKVLGRTGRHAGLPQGVDVCCATGGRGAHRCGGGGRGGHCGALRAVGRRRPGAARRWWRGRIDAMAAMLADAEDELGRIDAIAGDGDHGRGMVKGSSAAREAAARAVADGAGQGSVLTAAGKEWAAKAGGTSGVLWGAMLSALGARLGDRGRPDSATVAAGMRDGYDALVQLGGAAPGDKTMLDALLPFVEELQRRVDDGEPVAGRVAGRGRSRDGGRAGHRRHAAEDRPGASASRTQCRHARRRRDLAGDVRAHGCRLLHAYCKGRQLMSARAAGRRRFRRRRIRIQGSAEGRSAHGRSSRGSHRRRGRHRRKHGVPAHRGGRGSTGRGGQGGPGAAGLWNGAGRGDQRQQGAGYPRGHRA